MGLFSWLTSWSTFAGPTVESSESPAMILRRARRLKFRVSQRSLSELTGAYTGARPGMGLSFAELKPYEPGDDVRHIDWNVTARQERPYVRRYSEERSLTLWIVVDISASLRFGLDGRSKADRAIQAAALLATSATRSGDKVGLLLVSDRIEAELPPGRGPRHLAKLLRMLVATPSRSRATLFEDVPARIRATTRRALIVVLSDFLFDPFPPAEPWAKLGRWNRLVGFRVVDPREEELPAAGLLDLRDLETGKRFVVDSQSSAVRDAYREAAIQRRERFRDWCTEARIEAADFPTNVDPLSPLLRFFARAPRRRPR